jgi:DnaJ-class molecular chaperone
VRFDQGGGGGFDDLFGGGGLGDFFNRFFTGGGGAGPEPGRPSGAGGDVEARVRLSFDQALQGGKTEVELPDGDRVRIDVPKGVRPGFKIRLRGRGQPGPGGARGALYVTFDIEPHARFRREGDDLYVTETIGAFDALLGTSRSITTAYGRRIRLRIPPGTQPGAKLRVKEQGVQTEKGAGDLYVEIAVHIPQHLTEAQREALKKAAEEAGLI